MDKLGICNMALAHIGATPILSLTEESEEARRVVQFYDNDRRVVLRRCPWPFARRRTELTPLETVPLGYAYAFRYPSGCLYLRKVCTVDTTETIFTPVEYSIASDSTGRVLYCDESRVIVDYTADVEEVALMDEQFCEVLSWKLAASVAFKLVGNPEVTQLATQEYERLCQEAISNALNEQNNGLGKETNKLTICNAALSNIGVPPIESLSDVSEQARRVVQFYEQDRRLMLRQFLWPWARRRVELTPLAENPQEYTYAFRYPENCVCLRKVFAVRENEQIIDSVEYIIASDDTGRIICCDETRLIVEYTLDITDTEVMDEQFREALTWKLSASVAAKLLEKPDVTKMAIAEYDRLIREAAIVASNEQNKGVGKVMDKTTICNMALSYIGETPIESIAEVSEQARRCSQFYEHDRRLVLRRYPWPWATRRVSLVALDTHPPDYDYAYRCPSDCVCVRKLYAVNEAGGFEPWPDFVEYKIVSDSEGWVLYTNAQSALMEYTADIQDNELMDEQFCEVLSWKLAASIASRLLKAPEITQRATAEYERLYSEAIANATNEQNIETPPLNTFIRARFGG